MANERLTRTPTANLVESLQLDALEPDPRQGRPGMSCSTASDERTGTLGCRSASAVPASSLVRGSIGHGSRVPDSPRLSG
jgi:hypothetical protein